MKNRIVTYLIFIALLYSGSINSQLKTGDWRDYFSHSSCNFISTSGNKIVAANTLGLFFLVKEDNSYLRLNKTNGLNDIDICSMLVMTNGSVIIGYENGNIDIIEEEKVVSIPDLKNKSMTGSKKINHFFEYNNKVYCSLPFGIMVVDPYKHEIADTYYIGPNGTELRINQIAELDGFLYAATETGILRAPADSPALGAFDTWEETTSSTENYNSIITFNDYLLAAKGDINSTNIIYYFQNEVWTILKSTNNFRGFATDDKSFGIISINSIELLDPDLHVFKIIDKYNFEGQREKIPSIASAAIDRSSGNIFIADNEFGAVEISDDPTDKFFYPDGPASNSVFDIAVSTAGIYTTAGGLDASWNNLVTPAEYSFYDGVSWSSFRRNDTIQEQKDWRDLLKIAIDPSDPGHAFICSWGTGVFEASSGELINHFDQYNSGLQNIEFATKDYYVRVGGIAVDKNRNVWMNNGEVNNGLVFKPYKKDLQKEDWIQYTYKALHNLHSMGQILITKDDYFWMIIPRTNKAGLFVFDINNTVEDQSDDWYRCAVSPSIDSDPRNAGQLKLWDENGEEITNRVYSLAEDKNGYIWVGTNKGILVYYRPYAIFDEEKPIISRIKVPRNDGSNLADYLLEKETVTAIAIDGGNRKWLGTASSGIFLVSEDGTKTIQSFNVDNSPLLSNSINSIAIHPKTGEVFIGTAKGIVSYKALATEGADSYSKIYAYPNPVRENYSGDIIITGLMENSTLKIVDISGKLVHETKSIGGQAIWNGRNLHGKKVKTGVYVVFISNEDGSEKATTKILIVN